MILIAISAYDSSAWGVNGYKSGYSAGSAPGAAHATRLKPMASHTFLWHDYETFGANTRRDRPAQFAAIRTDAELNEIGRASCRERV